MPILMKFDSLEIASVTGGSNGDLPDYPMILLRHGIGQSNGA